MEFGSVRGSLVNPHQLIRATYSQGKISLPVAREYSLYARFKHVQGVPSDEGGGAVSLKRIVVLNSLIEGLSQKRSQQAFGLMPGDSEERLDFLTEQYSRELHMAVNSSPALFVRNSSAHSGSLINLVA